MLSTLWSRVDRTPNIAIVSPAITDAEGPEGGEGADCCEIGRAGCDHAEYCGYTQGGVEGVAVTANLAAEAPKHRSCKETKPFS